MIVKTVKAAGLENINCSGGRSGKHQLLRRRSKCKHQKKGRAMEKYRDIINLPHHVSSVHPPMSMINRAAQFSPFAALSGYDDAIVETARLTDRRIELTEAEEAEIGKALSSLKRGDKVEMTWFVPDRKKDGGRYVTETVTVKQVVAAEGKVVLMDGRGIEIASIIGVEA